MHTALSWKEAWSFVVATRQTTSSHWSDQCFKPTWPCACRRHSPWLRSPAVTVRQPWQLRYHQRHGATSEMSLPFGPVGEHNLWFVRNSVELVLLFFPYIVSYVSDDKFLRFVWWWVDFFLQNLKLSLIYGATGVHDDNLNNWSVYMNIIYKQFALNVYNNRIYSTSKAHEFDIWTNQKKNPLLKKKEFFVRSVIITTSEVRSTAYKWFQRPWTRYTAVRSVPTFYLW